jgi:large subunit ribosomal protein L10
MSKNIEAKKGVVADIRQKFEKAQSAVLVDYRGLNVAEDTELRNQLRKAGVEYAVLKNTMINLAVKDMGIDDIKAHLEGPTAVAFGYEDAVAPAKVLSEFIKKSKKMSIKCGVCDGAYIDEAGVQALANTPSREVLIAKIMGSMMSSVSKFVYALEAIRKKQAGEE